MTNLKSFISNTFLFSILLSLLTLSCNDDDQLGNPSAPFPLKVGNYWIYQVSVESETGEIVPTENYDSVYISGVETINEEEYFTLVGWYGGTERLRDSLGYLVNSEGKIYFSPQGNDEVFFSEKITLGSEDRFISVNYTMQSEENIMTPAGEFSVQAAEGEFDYTEAPSNFLCDKRSRNYYSQEVGRIKEEVFYQAACTYRHRNLVRYHLE